VRIALGSDFFRNAIAAAAVVLTLGGGVLNWISSKTSDVNQLQVQIAEQGRDISTLKDLTHAILCKLDPTSIDCGRNGY